MMPPITYVRDADNIVTLTFDSQGQRVNTLNDEMRDCLIEMIERVVAEKDSIAGVIFASAKNTFFAGGDLNYLYQLKADGADQLFEQISIVKRAFRQLETIGKPVVAAINGSAVGGGFELALACHYRVCVNDPKIQLGLPEASLGLLPGLGGVVRMNLLLGLIDSQPYLQEGKLFTPEHAGKAGLVHELVSNQAELSRAARAWILSSPAAVQPWDIPGYQVPGGRPGAPELDQWIGAAMARLRAKTKGRYPAPEAILLSSIEGMKVSFDQADLIETQEFIGLVTGSVAKNLIGTFWFQLNSIKAGAGRPKNIDARRFTKIAVLGAGMMGAGIAYVAASRGIVAVVKDLSVDVASKALQNAQKILSKRVEKKEITTQQQQQILERIQPTERYEDFAGVQLVIEAVSENPELKASVTQAAEAYLSDAVIWASNTSTLPITGLAHASRRAAKFIGLHFFSPAHRMPLVEVIVGRETSQETLAHALDFVMQIGKTPIVVNDSRGFFTSRVFSTFTREGVAMLGEGQDAASIEAGALSAGFLIGPLAVLDEVSLSLSFNNRLETLKAFAEEGRPLAAHPADAVMKRMLEEFGRKGRLAGGGFYDYAADGTKKLWPGLTQFFNHSVAQISVQDIEDRLLFCMALESVRILQEGVLNEVRDGNIGSVMGIGFPRWTGGVFQFLNQYGLHSAVNRARELAALYGERFNPPELLIEKAERAELFE